MNNVAQVLAELLLLLIRLLLLANVGEEFVFELGGAERGSLLAMPFALLVEHWHQSQPSVELFLFLRFSRNRVHERRQVLLANLSLAVR